MVASKKKILLGRIIIYLLLALIMIQPGLANVVFQPSSESRTFLSKLLELLEYEPLSRGKPGDTKDAGSRASENSTWLSELLEYEPPSRGKPGDTENAGSRGACDFLAIVPAHRYGLTAAEYPTFWFYLNSQASLPKSVNLELKDEQHNLVYKTTFEVTQSEKIIYFRLPQTAPPLAIGHKYRWILSYGGIDDEMYTSGQIERIALDPVVESQLKQANPRERLYILAKNHLWYDTLTELNQLRSANNQDSELNEAWSVLLESTFRKSKCHLVEED